MADRPSWLTGDETPPQAQPKSSLIGAAIRAFEQGATLNWSDEAGAKLASAIPGSKTEAEYLKTSRAENAQAEKDHPYAWPIAKFIGTATMASRFPTATGRLGAMGAGGLLGGLSAAGASEGSATDKLKAGAWGLGLGMATGLFVGPATNRYIDEAPERALASKSLSELATEKKSIMEQLQGPAGPGKGELMQKLSTIDQAMGRAMESRGKPGLGMASLGAAALGHPVAAIAGLGLKGADAAATQAMAALTNAVRNGNPLAAYISNALKAGIPAATINQIVPTASDLAQSFAGD